MRLRNVKNSEEILNNCPNIVKEPIKWKGQFNKLFNNDNPIYMEIGMGKGTFIIGMANKYPNINFIGLEKYTSVICRTAEKIDNKIDNLLLINIDALNLENIFDKEIDTIYLTFSDPWPKDRHEKRRLSSNRFLEIYDKIFKNHKNIILKTDNDDFFEYSLSSLQEYGYAITELNRDLDNSNIENVKTEYETKFSNLGKNINYLKAYKD